MPRELPIPPAWWPPQEEEERFARERSPELEAALQRADTARGYLHWADFKHLPAPAGWSQEGLWALVKSRRWGAFENLEPLQGRHGARMFLNASRPLAAALHRIDTRQNLWRAVHRGPGSPQADIGYRLMAAIEEAHHSSAIEGAVTTRRQSKDLILSGRAPRDNSERMVWNNFQAIERLEAWASRPLSVDLVGEVHSVITDGTLESAADVGHVRQDDEVRILDQGTNEVVWTPPPASELPQRLAHLCTFANRPLSDEQFVHPLVRAILVHHQLAYDHPFGDGNGRTARALFVWSALRSGYHWFRSLSISRAVNRARQRYYRAFREVQTDEQDAHDVTYFVRQQIRCIEQETEHLARFLEERIALEGWLESKRASTKGLNARQLALVDHALQHPETVFTAREHRQYHRITQPTAWKDLTNLVERGLLLEGKQGRKSLYTATSRLVELAQERPPRPHR